MINISYTKIDQSTVHNYKYFEERLEETKKLNDMLVKEVEKQKSRNRKLQADLKISKKNYSQTNLPTIEEMNEKEEMNKKNQEKFLMELNNMKSKISELEIENEALKN